MSDPEIDKLVKKGREAAETVVEPIVEPVSNAARKTVDGFRRFAEIEASGGLVLLVAAIAAIGLSNSPFSEIYHHFLETHVEIRMGEAKLDKSLHHWINDGLMAIFFFLVGMEIKREAMEGALRRVDQLVLPGVAALGGILVPVGIFVFVNWGHPEPMEGWAIPAATDIAFAMAVLSLFGSRIPKALTAFLLAVAIFDDMAAILVIALFYSDRLADTPLLLSALCFVLLLVMNLSGVRRPAAYLIVGAILWIAVLKSGVHATLAGVLTALAIPLDGVDGQSPLKSLEDALHPWVAFLVLPLFGFANAGISFADMELSSVVETLPLGIILGLFLGKQIGITLSAALVIAIGFARLPERTSWLMLYGVSILAGIGFTMSLFITGLAFDNPALGTNARLGVIIGSIASAVAGILVLAIACAKASSSQD